MKKLFITMVLAFSLLLSIPAFSMDASKETAIATNTSMNNAYTTNNTNDGHNNTTRAYATGDNRTNWGWLGLLGLIGLAGSRNRSRDPQK